MDITYLRGAKLRKLTYIITTATLLFLMAFTSTAGPGGADDPLVSTSFLKTIFTDVFENTLKTKISVSQDKDKTDFEAKLGEYDKKTDALISGESIIKDAVKKSVNEKISQGALGKASVITLDKGERILGGLGTKMVIIDGSAKLFGKQGDVINLTRGGTANVNTVAPKNTNYFFGADKTSGFEAEANGTKILITGNFKKEGMYTPQNTKYADALYKLNLFKGTDNEIGRASCRERVYDLE